ncbi:methyltransferase family protein [Aspergillus brunneoviolaceus CBS 621.78]|uniref:Uncharacterized protein n=1 Tax=Aspergillus brunneoviolaceus CBS 621.78 TaxID=1450534 RepID=A0ACD1FX67_9EURO|nr:hypothetical protein BO95DRAFT_263663 [Aspergillus brunneoviolaceus CBS 621.78]RAH41552.1 hypothetical protein BO95DRAFT_263663 [Aspergillus brunneoviolaceus CBS 621.78]
MPTLPTLALTLAYTVSSYLALRCLQPPSPELGPDSSNKSKSKDSVATVIDPLFLLMKLVIPMSFLYQALLTLLHSHPSSPWTTAICRSPANPPTEALTWTPSTATSLLLFYIGGWTRLAAFRALGGDFTFHLATPDDGLVTDGVYRYVQHPSYSGGLLMVAGYVRLALEEFVPAMGTCWSGSGETTGLGGVAVVEPWGRVGLLLLTTGVFLGITYFRVQDEERMLKRDFGAEWERWHRRTARLIPFVW